MPAVAEVQVGDDTSGGVTSGVAFNMGANAAANSDVYVFIRCFGTSVLSITGLGAQWSRLSTISPGSGTFECWQGLNCTGGSSAITVTNNGGSTYACWYAEVSNGGVAVAITPASGTSTSPALTATGLAPNRLVLAAVRVGTGPISAGPTSPWAVYNTGTGGWTWTSGRDVASQVTSGSANQTATWTQPSGTWVTSGVVVPSLGGMPPQASGMSIAVARSAFFRRSWRRRDSGLLLAA